MKLEPTLDTLIQVLQQIYPEEEDFCRIFKSLKTYKFVENLRTLKPGNYIRTIDLREVNKGLSYGGFIIAPKSPKKEYILLKGFGNRIFHINSNFNILFVKLNDDDIIKRYQSFKN